MRSVAENTAAVVRNKVGSGADVRAVDEITAAAVGKKVFCLEADVRALANSVLRQ